MPEADLNAVFVARQPILDARGDFVAFELLFRPSQEARQCLAVGVQQSARVMMDAVTAVGLDLLTRGKPAFVNVTRELLLEGAPRALPPGGVVVELLEDIEADADVLAACQALRRAGYRIALDDFALTDATAGLVPLADYVKIDFLNCGSVEREHIRSHLASLGRPDLKLLAEKVETQEVFSQAQAEGYEFFQGYFFGQPVTTRARAIPTGKLEATRLLYALNDPELTFDRMEALVKRNAALSFQVLRTVNSAGFGLRQEVRTMREALLLLGLQPVRRWASLLVFANLGEGGGDGVVRWSSVRARFCELLASRALGSDDGPRGFLLGLCSLLDALLDCPMPSILETLPLDPDLTAALLGADTRLRRLLDCVMAYERADWDRCASLAAGLGISADALPAMYAESLRWVTAGDTVAV